MSDHKILKGAMDAQSEKLAEAERQLGEARDRLGSTSIEDEEIKF